MLSAPVSAVALPDRAAVAEAQLAQRALAGEGRRFQGLACKGCWGARRRAPYVWTRFCSACCVRWLQFTSGPHGGDRRQSMFPSQATPTTPREQTPHAPVSLPSGSPEGQTFLQDLGILLQHCSGAAEAVSPRMLALAAGVLRVARQGRWCHISSLLESALGSSAAAARVLASGHSFSACSGGPGGQQCTPGAAPEAQAGGGCPGGGHCDAQPCCATGCLNSPAKGAAAAGGGSCSGESSRSLDLSTPVFSEEQAPPRLAAKLEGEESEEERALSSCSETESEGEGEGEGGAAGGRRGRKRRAGGDRGCKWACEVLNHLVSPTHIFGRRFLPFLPNSLLV